MFALLLYLCFFLGNPAIIWWVNPIAVAIGAVLPDCDHPHAPAGKFIPLWIFGIKHRGPTHTVYACVFVCLLGSVAFDWKVGISLALGYLTHLLLDATTPSGVAWLGKRKARPK